ncbi:NAD(P)-dependent dehydrogenase (short-subunit alcohol dehydrogenase family) [Gelidibacter algens]|uniref:NAD(P)-dependent dehydrogenase (Short-subunit alcohol dehydrogenase family) n=1 Tax=Gelidibacter algens TaxID=49280 RepID=A0A1A7R3K2_9FLAO|nr:SDR family oxidoreductase [Gelidibacter algens]OBX26044.1 D-mannonate oxidoreductase [Gelidibacter algens]RAJ27684.1 NAD(P)-dependent dehydrogenase (short-subunit alcohol dehydrogenase family) [Gelidibacter algens]
MTKNNYKDKVAVITGGSGVIGAAISKGLALEGVKVVILGRTQDTITTKVKEIQGNGGIALGISADVLNKTSLENAKGKIIEAFGRIDILINAAGGNVKGATIQPDEDFFEMEMDAFDTVTDLNLKGTVLPCLIFGKEISKQEQGCIINISSLAAQQVLTRVVGYSASKAAVENFTKWLAVEMAQKLSTNLRVNAIAPGFFIGKQNRDLLLNSDGTLTARGQTIISNTPMKRFGEAEELLSTVLWMCSDTSKFITGIVVHVDGGFSAYSGV